MKLMTADIATTTALAIGDVREPCPLFVTARFPVTGQDFGGVYLKFGRWLDDQIVVHRPDVFAFEAPLPDFGGGKRKMVTNFQTARLLKGLAAVAEYVAAARSLRRFEVNVGTIKKHMTGSGRADKDAMKRAARARGWPIKNDHEADAGAIWSYGVACLAPQHAAAHTALFTNTGGSAA